MCLPVLTATVLLAICSCPVLIRPVKGAMFLLLLNARLSAGADMHQSVY
jgi:hypothetical protein